jgi:hypothetical protein
MVVVVVEADHHLQGEVVSLKLALAPAPVEVDRRPRVIPSCRS